MAMAEGMHTQMPTEYLGQHVVQRCRKIWWTVYILDREMTSLMGLPQSINDDHVNTQLPTFPECVQRTAAIGMHIKLSRIVAKINSSQSTSHPTNHPMANSVYSGLRDRRTTEPKLPPAHQNRLVQHSQHSRRASHGLPTTSRPSGQRCI